MYPDINRAAHFACNVKTSEVHCRRPVTWPQKFTPCWHEFVTSISQSAQKPAPAQAEDANDSQEGNVRANVSSQEVASIIEDDPVRKSCVYC